MDKITLKSLSFHGRHGYYENERVIGNEFELDVTARGDFRSAVEDDDLGRTFNYEVVYEVASAVFSGKEEKLIETLCIRIGDELFHRFPHLKKLSVSVRKLNPPIDAPAKWAGVTMKWKR